MSVGVPTGGHLVRQGGQFAGAGQGPALSPLPTPGDETALLPKTRGFSAHFGQLGAKASPEKGASVRANSCKAFHLFRS